MDVVRGAADARQIRAEIENLRQKIGAERVRLASLLARLSAAARQNRAKKSAPPDFRLNSSPFNPFDHSSASNISAPNSTDSVSPRGRRGGVTDVPRPKRPAPLLAVSARNKKSLEAKLARAEVKNNEMLELGRRVAREVDERRKKYTLLTDALIAEELEIEVYEKKVAGLTDKEAALQRKIKKMDREIIKNQEKYQNINKTQKDQINKLRKDKILLLKQSTLKSNKALNTSPLHSNAQINTQNIAQNNADNHNNAQKNSEQKNAQKNAEQLAQKNAEKLAQKNAEKFAQKNAEEFAQEDAKNCEEPPQKNKKNSQTIARKNAEKTAQSVGAEKTAQFVGPAAPQKKWEDGREEFTKKVLLLMIWNSGLRKRKRQLAQRLHFFDEEIANLRTHTKIADMAELTRYFAEAESQSFSQIRLIALLQQDIENINKKTAALQEARDHFALNFLTNAPNTTAPNITAPNITAPNIAATNIIASNISAPNISAPNITAPNYSLPKSGGAIEKAENDAFLRECAHALEGVALRVYRAAPSLFDNVDINLKKLLENWQPEEDHEKRKYRRKNRESRGTRNGDSTEPQQGREEKQEDVKKKESEKESSHHETVRCNPESSGGKCEEGGNFSNRKNDQIRENCLKEQSSPIEKELASEGGLHIETPQKEKQYTNYSKKKKKKKKKKIRKKKNTRKQRRKSKKDK